MLYNSAAYRVFLYTRAMLFRIYKEKALTNAQNKTPLIISSIADVDLYREC